MKHKALLISIVASGISAFGGVQFDLRGNHLFTQRDAETDAPMMRSVQVQSYVHAQRTSASGLSLFLTHRLDGTPHADALPENTLPFDNHTACGLRFMKKHLFQVAVENDIFGHAENSCPYFYPPDSSVSRKALTSLNQYFQVRGKKVRLTVAASYFRVNYELRYGDDGLTRAVDDDLWSEADFRISPNDHIAFSAGTTLKNDFNAYDGYDYGDHYVSMDGDHEVPLKARKFSMTWLLSGHWRISEMMYLREDAQGPAAVITMRPAVKLRNRIFLKGATMLDLSDKMQKQKYELSIRKSWKNLSSVDVGCWATAGALFPRRGTDVGGVFYLSRSSRFGLSPQVHLFWMQDSDNDEFRFYRTTASVEMILNLFHRAEITGGYTWSDFIDRAPFTDRGVISLGLRKW